MTYNEIINAVEEHLDHSAQPYYSSFYVGITDDIDKDLFGFHQVPKEGHWYIYCPADNIDIAHNVEQHFHDLGMDSSIGDTPGGDSSIVYCYEKSDKTKER